MIWSIRLVAAAALFLPSSIVTANAESLSSWGANRFRHHVRETVQPISVNIIDPMTRAYSLPSGRVFISDRYHGHSYNHYQRGSHHYTRQTTPYAPPAFYIIGEPTRKNMSTPVVLNHGIQPRRGLKTQPNVVFLVQKPGQKFLSVRN
jgi:hypothetical protein